MKRPPRQTGTRARRSVLRLIIGLLLEYLVFYNLTHRPLGQTHGVFVWYLGINLVIAAVGIWLAISYLASSN